MWHLQLNCSRLLAQLCTSQIPQRVTIYFRSTFDIVMSVGLGHCKYDSVVLHDHRIYTDEGATGHLFIFV